MADFPKITSRTRLAVIFDCDRKTIYNEIKRGTVEYTRSDLSKVYEYNAEYAQKVADGRNANRGSVPKIMLDTALARELKRLVADEGYSPYAVVAELNATGWPSSTRAVEKTVYNWVNEGLIYGVSRTNLPNKGVKYREKGSTRRYSRAKCEEHSIENRPKEADDRNNFGHWELDTVKGGKDTSTECLFTMTERKSRREIARKMPDAKGKSTVEVLDEIERQIGSEAFRRTFITMTCDGGTEFMEGEGIERSCIDGKPRTKLYFAHPYTACERGTNENHNRILRRFFPKGCDFSKATDEDVARAEDWMNNYPRRIHGGKTPAMIYRKCCYL
ncbi:MAG: IS30 family transposase [Treponema sp.]|nr:IS30 family transposase [Treponema sp.]